jgi:hypothetical protein
LEAAGRMIRRHICVTLLDRCVRQA